MHLQETDLFLQLQVFESYVAAVEYLELSLSRKCSWIIVPPYSDVQLLAVEILDVPCRD